MANTTGPQTVVPFHAAPGHQACMNYSARHQVILACVRALKTHEEAEIVEFDS